MDRELTYIEAIREATEICLEEDPAVTVIGLGVPDPKGIFGTTSGLREKFGDARIMDAPISENALTGMVVGGALAGLRPILTHQRVDFALLSLEQIINQAAKWHYMFDAKGGNVPIVIRMIVGRGWGQGPQHSQSLYSLFAHIPGLRVVAPSTPREAKGVFLSAVRDPNPVIFLEHRWLHGLKGPVPSGGKGLSLNAASVARKANDITIVAFSYGLIEAMRAARFLAETSGINCEVVDLRTLNPLDWTTIEKSIAKTRRLLVIDEDHRHCGFAAEVMARAIEYPVELLTRPIRLTLPDFPSPSSSFLASEFYYDAKEICRKILILCGKEVSLAEAYPLSQWADKPSFDFPGPFLKNKIPYVDLAARQQPLKEELMRAVEGVIVSGQFILGPETTSFEQEFAALCNTSHAIGVNSGTDALVLALRASGISAGDEVITAPNSYLSSASCIALTGASVRFADVRDDLNMDPAELEAAITPNTKADIVVHLTGRPAAMDEILSITKPRGIILIEDAAQAVGAKYRGKPVGSLGDIGCFSMHPLKNLDACGDAGIVVTDCLQVADRIRLLRNHGQPNRDECVEFSMVSRLDSIQAAMLRVKLRHLDTVTSRRRGNAELYRQLLSGIPGVKCPVDKQEEHSVYHTFVIQSERRDALKQFLAEAGIGTAIHYPTPIHLMRAGRKLGFGPNMFPVAEKQAERILSLPVHEGLTEQDLRTVATEIHNFHKFN